MSQLISIVMPCHNRREALYKTLESICSQTCSSSKFEVLVVDQASTDGSRDIARSFKSKLELQVIEQDAKYGISVARNAGIESASNDWVLLLDADLIADPGLLEAHISFCQKHPQTVICGRVKPYPPAYSSYIERIANPDIGLDRGEDECTLAFYDSVGGHMLFSKEAFADIGPFDPKLKGFEDVDFAYRAILLGIPILNNPKAISYHNHPRTFTERFKQARTYNRMLPILFDRYPELKGKLPLLSNNELIHWRQDNGRQIMNKLITRVFASHMTQSIATVTLKLMDRYRCLPRLVRFLYWKLLIGNWYIGYRDGLALLEQSSISS